MKNFIKIFSFIFVSLLMFSCSNSGTKDKTDIRYAKVGEKEYIFINGEKKLNYNLSSLDNRVDIDFSGFDTSELDTNRLAQESSYIQNAQTYITNSGSSLSFNFKNKPGFKVIKRKNGLVLALGKNYTPVSDDELDDLEERSSHNIKIERDMDSLLSEMGKTKTISEGSLSGSELNRLKKDVDRDKKLDRELKDLEYEQDLVDDTASNSAIVSFVKLVRGTKTTRLIMKGTKPFTYIKNDAETKNYKVTFDFHNTYIPLSLSNVVDDMPSFGPVKKIAFYQSKWKSYNLAKLVFFLRTPLDLMIINVGNIAYVDIPNRVIAKSRRVSNTLARNMMPENNLGGYLANTKKYYGKRISIEVYDAKVSDVLRLLQKVSKINFVVSEDIKSRISISLKRLPWDQALDAICHNAQLGYIKEGRLIRVAPLTHIRDERLIASQAKEATERLESLGVMVYNASFADPKILKDKIVALLSSRGRMSLGPDRVLMVNDTKSSLFKIKSFLESYKSVILGRN